MRTNIYECVYVTSSNSRTHYMHHHLIQLSNLCKQHSCLAIFVVEMDDSVNPEINNSTFDRKDNDIATIIHFPIKHGILANL